MAVLCPLPEVHQSIQSYSDTWIHVLMATSEISEDPATQFVEDRMYVAVGKDLKESKLTLAWALHNSGGRKICILHVHQPAQRIPFMGTKVLVSQLDEGQVRAYRETERQEMDELLRNYNMIFNQAGVHADTVHIEMDSVEKGIVELISQHGIRKLVMGAAADKQYSKRMMEPKSKKAIYVRQQAPTFCHIWFICKGKLVHTREGRLDGGIMEVASPVLPASPNTGSAPSSSLRSPSVIEGRNDSLRRTCSGPGFHSVRSEILGMEHVNSSLNSSEGVHTRSRLSSDGTLNDWNDFPRRSLSVNSCWSSCASSDIIDGSPLILNAGPVAGFDSSYLQRFKELHLSPPVVLEGGLNDELYDQLERAMADADNSRREAFEESMRRRKAEKDVFDSSRRAKTSETLYTEELRRRKETEEALARGQEEVEKMKIQLDEVMEELRVAQEQKASLEGQIADSDQMVQDLEHKMFSAIELLQKYKYERDELEVERDDALKVAKELRRNQAEEASSTLSPHFFSGFSFSEIKEATNSFDLSLKIGEGGYGSIYKGILRHTQVAIKVPHSHSSQGPSEFEQEVNILSKLRHPNLVTLIGACPEAWILVYEYLPNGSLEDRLSCKDNTPPLTWQTRIRIAAELCSVLIFLHSCNPGSIVHGDVKPANILLDANYVSKLGDFGICRVLTRGVYSSGNTTLCHRTDPKGTIAYMDPEFFATSDLTAKSDVYSFGIILLRLLTGRSALGIVKEVKCALNNGNLKELLDPTAGDWPFVQAKQLALLAIRCNEMNRKNRPDLASEVSKVLGPMRVSCGASSSRISSEEHYQIPHYFICPIFQEIMQDPHVAADGYTYELEALRGWLDGGHDTSPMTDLQLPHHNLVPNRALRSAIQEWKQL